MMRKRTHRWIFVLLIFALLCCVMANPALATLLEDRAAAASSASFAVPELLGVADASADYYPGSCETLYFRCDNI